MRMNWWSPLDKRRNVFLDKYKSSCLRFNLPREDAQNERSQQLHLCAAVAAVDRAAEELTVTLQHPFQTILFSAADCLTHSSAACITVLNQRFLYLCERIKKKVLYFCHSSFPVLSLCHSFMLSASSPSLLYIYKAELWTLQRANERCPLLFSVMAGHTAQWHAALQSWVASVPSVVAPSTTWVAMAGWRCLYCCCYWAVT